jgi:aromatic-L-amino-acid decarboxylase
VYGSTQTHSSIRKATMVLGCTHGEVACDATNGSMDVAALEARIAADAEAGRVPFIVVATLGTTSTGAMDDISAIAAVCERHSLWLHVDAAYAGAALVCPEFRAMAAGLDRADSFNFNCHKWMLVNFDLSAFWVSDRSALIDALSFTPVYMRNAASESGLVCDYRDWQVPLGRRFRSLKLWFVMRMYGAKGIRAIVREHVRLGRVFQALIEEDPRFELPVPPSLSLVCFSLAGRGNAANRALVERINADGRIFIIGTEFEGKAIIRFVPVTESVTEDHVRRAYASIGELADKLLAEPEFESE